ncbi:MAG: NUDIX domain-containing protein [Myxococcota bacterium]
MIAQQAAAVPFRIREDGQLEFCLITSSDGRWIFPKGVVESGDTIEETALNEAAEEAGLQGRIIDYPLGHYRTTKWRMTLEVVVVLMEVDAEEEEWPEADVRERCWVSADEARSRLEWRSRELLPLLEEALHRLT